MPKVCRFLEEAEEDLIALYLLPSEHWTQLQSTDPLERANKKIGAGALTWRQRRRCVGTLAKTELFAHAARLDRDPVASHRKRRAASVGRIRPADTIALWLAVGGKLAIALGDIPIAGVRFLGTVSSTAAKVRPGGLRIRKWWVPRSATRALCFRARTASPAVPVRTIAFVTGLPWTG